MSENLRVVIVDDTPDMRLLVRLSLELDPHIEVVDEAADGRQAIDLAARTRPDVMLLDLAMPVMDGMQALPKVVAASPGTAVLVLSGFAASAMAEDAIAAGAAGYLQKGIGAEELCQRVWEASGRPRPQREDVFALPTEATEPGPVVSATVGADVAARAADLAPAGLVVLGVPPGAPAHGWIVLYLNPEAGAVLGVRADRVGELLGDLAPALVPVVDELCAHGADPSREAHVSVGPAEHLLRVRRQGDEVVLSLVRIPVNHA